jgi:membrane associated rhomboid family serine protease
MYGRGNIMDEFKDAFRRPDNGVIQLILINLAVFLALLLLKVISTWGGFRVFYDSVLLQLMMPASAEKFILKPWTLLTYFFLHEGLFHILFNLLFLYWFGRIIKEYLGSAKVVSLYVLGGIMGGLTYLILYNFMPYFSGVVDKSVMLGASAGVYAVVVGAATFMPNYTIMLIFLGPVRIKYIALFYVILSFAQSTGENAGGEIAHLGGALIGFVYMRQFQKGNDIGAWVHSVLGFFQSFFTSRPKMKVHASEKTASSSYKSPSGQGAKSDKPNQAEIDAILDKISQSGYESLSKDEKQKLFNASKK